MQKAIELAKKHTTMKYLAKEIGMSCNMLRYNLMRAHRLESVKKTLLENKEAKCKQ